MDTHYDFNKTDMLRLVSMCGKLTGLLRAMPYVMYARAGVELDDEQRDKFAKYIDESIKRVDEEVAADM